MGFIKHEELIDEFESQIAETKRKELAKRRREEAEKQKREERLNTSPHDPEAKVIDSTRSLGSAEHKTFVITGILSRGTTRSEAKQLIKIAGGNVKDYITNNTDYLVIGHGGLMTKKYKDAVEKGVLIINEKTLVSTLNNSPKYISWKGKQGANNSKVL